MSQSVVCICSRGLVHSRTVEAIERNLDEAIAKGYAWSRKKVWTHSLPIPEAQNAVVEMARQYQPEWLWFVEEDMQPGDGVLIGLLEFGSRFDVVSARYRLKGGAWCRGGTDTNPTFVGLGCLLVRMSVFDRIGLPYFRSDLSFDSSLNRPSLRPSQERVHGGQDIYFYARLKQSGIKFFYAPIECTHLNVVRCGDPVSNFGFHDIRPIEE